MKRVVFSILTAGLLMTAVCNGASVMTMTTEKSGYVEVLVAGSGTFTIDWGDGSAIETETLLEYNDSWNEQYVYNHNYSGTSSRTIIITGENITHLICSDNQLTNLDVSKNTLLTLLVCSQNQLTSLDVSKNVALIKLLCRDNQLTNLDVSKNTMLMLLNCNGNQLNTDALNTLFGTLNSNAGIKDFFIRDNPGTKTCNRSIATNKGWAEDGYRFSNPTIKKSSKLQ